ncbi:hypothetical protein [Paenibacillus sp. NPDC057967]|uniref:hypothetical protein n=1 Tax=Paenibacillus sp. NPDC057967 TaxID=3346293 RepID=UPI0036DB4EB7
MHVKKIFHISGWIVFILFAVCLSVWAVKVNSNAHSTTVPFPYTHTDHIDPETLTNEILHAIGYPNAVPIVTKADTFRVVLYNHPHQQELDMKWHSLTSNFTIRIPEKNLGLSYQLQILPSGELHILYRNEIKFDGLFNEIPHPTTGYALIDLFRAIRDFPAVSYRELTEYGGESADLYTIGLNEGLLLAENFSYNKYGPVENDEQRDGIPFLVSNMKWGKIRDASLEDDDPMRYYSYGGEGGTNVYYYPGS